MGNLLGIMRKHNEVYFNTGTDDFCFSRGIMEKVTKNAVLEVFAIQYPNHAPTTFQYSPNHIPFIPKYDGLIFAIGIADRELPTRMEEGSNTTYPLVI